MQVIRGLPDNCPDLSLETYEIHDCILQFVCAWRVEVGANPDPGGYEW